MRRKRKVHEFSEFGLAEKRVYIDRSVCVTSLTWTWATEWKMERKKSMDCKHVMCVTTTSFRQSWWILFSIWRSFQWDEFVCTERFEDYFMKSNQAFLFFYSYEREVRWSGQGLHCGRNPRHWRIWYSLRWLQEERSPTCKYSLFADLLIKHVWYCCVNCLWVKHVLWCFLFSE